MKVRISGNSLRYRVSRSNLASLQGGGRVETNIHFAAHPDAKFTYALERSSSVRTVDVRYRLGEVTVVLSSEFVDKWSSTEQVGIYETINIGNAGALDVILEKDFACLDGIDAQGVDTFPNPAAGAVG
jgi:hypothetical protein